MPLRKTALPDEVFIFFSFIGVPPFAWPLLLFAALLWLLLLALSVDVLPFVLWW